MERFWHRKFTSIGLDTVFCQVQLGIVGQYVVGESFRSTFYEVFLVVEVLQLFLQARSWADVRDSFVLRCRTSAVAVLYFEVPKMKIHFMYI